MHVLRMRMLRVFKNVCAHDASYMAVHATLHNVQSDASLCTSGKSALTFANNKIMCLDHALASVVFLLKLLPGSFRAVNG